MPCVFAKCKQTGTVRRAPGLSAKAKIYLEKSLSEQEFAYLIPDLRRK